MSVQSRRFLVFRSVTAILLLFLHLSFNSVSAVELLHRYSFASNADDLIGNADGVLTNGAVISGGAVILDGEGAFVDLPNGLLSTLDDLTVETWLTDNNSGTWSRIFDFGNSTGGEGVSGSGTEYMFLSPQAGSGALRGAITIGSGEQLVEWPGTRLPSGVPAHVVWTYDSATETGRLYVEGVMVDEDTGITIKPSDMGVTLNNWIGRSQFAADPYLSATITEFRIYDAPLTPQEVQENFTFGPDALALNGPVTLLVEPVSQTVNELQPVTFTAAYSGTPPVSVQWYRGATAIVGATNESYSIGSASLADHNVAFHVGVSNNISGIPHTASSSNVMLSVIADLTAPVLVQASSLFPDGVLVEFSEGVRADTATNVSNYTITHAGGSLAVTAAGFGGSASNIVLTTAGQSLNTLYTLTVNNVRDLANAANLIDANSEATFTAVPYLTDDIGGPSLSGSVVAVPGGFDGTAGGRGFVGRSDQFTFSHKSISGDFDLQLRLAELEFSGTWARAGLMARSSLTASSVFAASFATPGLAGCHFGSRTVAGDYPAMEGFFPVNYPDTWIRLRRTGNLFEGFASLDGQAWQVLGSATISMPSTVEVGMALTSGDDTATATAQFRDETEGNGLVVQNLMLPFEPMGPSSRRTALVITEIMYDTPGNWGGTNSLEFVELWNSGLITEDLTGHRFSGEIDYTFPDGTLIAPGAFLVVAKDPAAAQSFYGVNCLGPYLNKLANNGGTLRLRNELDGILLEVDYDDRAPWPAAAAGTGHSLVLSHPSYGENDVRAWSPSNRIGGSPGAVDPYGSEPARGVVINEFLAHTDDPVLDYIELFNTGADPVDLSGAWLSDESGTNKFRIPNGTSIAGRGFRAYNQNQLGFALAADGERIFLVNSNETRVLDAVAFRGQANGVTSGRYPDGAPGFQELASMTQGAPNTPPWFRSLVINEIMYHPISESNNDEYIEIHNRGGSPMDLSNWRIQGGVSYEFPSNTVIGANGYLVIAENRTNLLSKYAQLNTANTVGNYSGSLNNSSERVALSMPEDLVSTNAQGTVITNIFYIVVDEVTYLDGGRWGEWSDGGGSSLELIDPDADNRLAANWADSDESSKAAWTTIDVTEILENGQSASVVDEGGAFGEAGDCNRIELFLQGAGEVLIDDVEFLNNGAGNLAPNGDFSGGTSGWGFGGVVRNSYVESGVGSGSSAALHLVSVARGDTGCNKAYHNLSSVPSISGSDTGTIRAKVRWLKGCPYILLRLRGNWMEASGPVNVPSNCGTPGQPNSRLVANAGPAIYDVGHDPILPAANEAVVVSARANDPDGVSSLTLHYRVDPSTSDTTVSMVDNGTGGDAVAGDGIYSASISGRSSGTLVAFHVSASDGSATTRFPVAAPERECLVRWGESVMSGTLGTYRLWVTAANLSIWGSREKNANDPLDATFVYGNHRVVYNVRTMYSASPFHTGAYNGPLGFSCDYEINFHPDERFLGSEPFVVAAEENNGDFWFDPTSQNDLAGTWIARKLGQQYNHRRHVHMVLNGVVRGDIYLDTQQPNSEMLDEYFPNDSNGELRKVESWFEFADNFAAQGSVYARLDLVNKSSGEIDTKWHRWNWRPRVTSNHDNWFAFTNLVMAVNDSSAANREARIRNWMDVRNYFRPIVVHHICGSWDSYAYSRGKNMYAYKPDDAGWRLLMWDIELSFAKGDSATANNLYVSEDPALFSMMQAIPSVEREYLMAYQEAVDTVLVPSLVDPMLDERYANLIANGVSVASPSSIKSYIASRRSYLQGVLPLDSFDVDGSSGFSVNSNSVVLTGSAPLQVYDILVNGVPYPVEWTSVTDWTLTVPLRAGANALLLTGVDRLGNAYPGADDSLTVTYTGSDVDPEGWVVINEIQLSPGAEPLQFIELLNTHANSTFDLSNWRINGVAYTFPPGSILPPQTHLLLVKDRFSFASQHDSPVVFDVFDGTLDPGGETLTLFRPGAIPGQEIVVDRVRYELTAPWSVAVDGSSLQLVDASRDNSRAANWLSTTDIAAEPLQNVIDITHTWKYSQSGDLGTAWRQPGYGDGGWSSGPALLYSESAGLPAPKNTQLTLGQNTYYFRTTFDYFGSAAGAALELSTVVDDGMVLYLNGQEIYRLGVGAGTVEYGTSASRVIGDAQYEGPFTLPATALVPGQNVIAVEVHQQAPDSSDVVFGMTLDVIPGNLTASSPGVANSVAAALPPFPDVWLNELQGNNVTGLQDNFGEHEPWVELYNAGPAPFSLDGYYLTDTYGNLTQWAFPAGASIPAGGFTVVWCDAEPGETVGNHLHAGFQLGTDSGQVALTRITNGGPQVVDYLNYTNLPSNWSYGDVPDGQPFYRSALFYATPGATNSGVSAPLTVFINEWLADNAGALTDPADGNYEDWFELYNPGSTTVDLGGYYLTDNLTNQFQFEIPNNGHYTIAPGGYLLVWADNESGQNSTNREDLHVNFALGKNGEAIGLFAADGTVIDAVTFGAQAPDVSQGRFPNGAANVYTLSTPTPRQGNLVPNTTPTLDAIADRILTLGQTLSFTASASDADVPAQSMMFSLTNAPAGASIHPTTGQFSWTPGAAFITNTMGVVVADNGTPGLSAVQTFTVSVVPAPVVGNVVMSGSQFSFSWLSVAGQEYQVYYKDELQEAFWNPIGGILTGTGGTISFTNAIGSAQQRFFRIEALPQTTSSTATAPTLGSVQADGSQLSFGWIGLPGQQYQVYSTDDLDGGLWDPVGPALNGAGAPLRFTNLLNVGSQRYFRVAAAL